VREYFGLLLILLDEKLFQMWKMLQTSALTIISTQSPFTGRIIDIQMQAI
jgi:hypothetical protein